MPANHRVGPAICFYGNPNVAAGAGMEFLGYTRGNLTVSTGLNVTTGKVDQVGMAPLAESVWSSGPMPTMTIPLIDEDKDKLVKYVLGSAKQTGASKESWGIGSGYTKVDNVDTVALIPVDELDQGTNGIDAPNGVWFPAATCTVFGDLIYNLPEGDDAHQPHEATFTSNYLEFDDRPITGTAKRTGAARILLPTSHRQMFIGSPGSIVAQTIGSTTYAAPAWSLPAVALPI